MVTPIVWTSVETGILNTDKSLLEIPALSLPARAFALYAELGAEHPSAYKGALDLLRGNPRRSGRNYLSLLRRIFEKDQKGLRTQSLRRRGCLRQRRLLRRAVTVTSRRAFVESANSSAGMSYPYAAGFGGKCV